MQLPQELLILIENGESNTVELKKSTTEITKWRRRKRKWINIITNTGMMAICTVDIAKGNIFCLV